MSINKIMKHFLTILFIILISLNIFAQSNDNSISKNNLLTIGINSDAFIGSEFGYGRNFSSVFENGFTIYFRFRFPLLLNFKDNSFSNWEINSGVNFEVLRTNHFGTFIDFQFFIMNHNQVLGSFVPVGFNVKLTPSYHFDNSYLGIQLNFHHTIATHISHSDYVKNSFSDLSGADKILLDYQPIDGWYSSTGTYFGLGLEGAIDISDNLNFYSDLGIIKFFSPYTSFFDAMMIGQVPFYGNFRLLYSF